MTELLLIVSIAGARVAIATADVESVVELEGLTPVPRAAAHVAGLSALRSRVLTVIDSVAALGLGSSAPKAQREAIVVDIDGHPYALIVEAVEDVVECEGAVQPVRTALDPGWKRVARGVVEVDGDLLLLIDAHALIAGPAAMAA
ncbi:MAG: chemotaxis protein CheW [Pseudomonadota bacterium]|nr:chemotaxis protein CheW [Pseudomonadota bacterium]